MDRMEPKKNMYRTVFTKLKSDSAVETYVKSSNTSSFEPIE